MPRSTRRSLYSGLALAVIVGFSLVVPAAASASTPIWGRCVLTVVRPQEVQHGLMQASGGISGCVVAPKQVQVQVCLAKFTGGFWSVVKCVETTVRKNIKHLNATVQAPVSSGIWKTEVIGAAWVPQLVQTATVSGSVRV
jgi:hypothetical protein